MITFILVFIISGQTDKDTVIIMHVSYAPYVSWCGYRVNTLVLACGNSLRHVPNATLQEVNVFCVKSIVVDGSYLY
jgi:hypothetical protein